MTTEAKTIFGIGIASIIIVVGGVLMLGQNSPPPQSDSKALERGDSYKISSTSAKVTVVEFADFQCPACGQAHPIVKQIIEQYQGKINFVYRHFPLPQHQNAQLAAEAAEAAGEQGKFWQMHDLLFENQSSWSEQSSALDIFVDYAKELNLDIDKFKKQVEDNKFADKIKRDVNDGRDLGVNATPTFFINGQKFPGVLGLAEFRNKIEAGLK